MSDSRRDASENAPQRLPIPSVTSELREVLETTHTLEDGGPLNIFLALAHHPRLLKRVNLLAGAFYNGTLESVDRETAILRVAATCECFYVFEKHASMAIGCGLSEADVEALRQAVPLSRWSGYQRALLEFTDSVMYHDCVEDSVWWKLPFHESAEAMVELTTLIGFYRMMCVFANVMVLDTEES